LSSFHPLPLSPGDAAPRGEFTTVSGATATLPDPDPAVLTHLQFRRFAGCPVCNLHLRSMVRRNAEIEAAGVRELVFFHAPADELRRYTADLPFAVVGDPERETYRAFGVESARRALLDPRVWFTILRAVAVSAAETLRGGKPLPPPQRPHGGRFGLPADFLIAADGTILAAKYGEHAGDQWSVDELLALAAEHTAPARQH
jgi:peroxiredoxin